MLEAYTALNIFRAVGNVLALFNLFLEIIWLVNTRIREWSSTSTKQIEHSLRFEPKLFERDRNHPSADALSFLSLFIW